ncbi:hypothetical protein PSHI8_08060 [Polynucleobacter sp. SHI8]|jgi:pyridoxine 5'-phosphate synthase PdxJ|uniref:DUF6088 family protein n=1 Tax=unclassified Polynucleobacter TaxID=2640945 RepID=UPI002493BE7E|nr:MULTISPECIES: DUF6088 family protein [unclassified Polynucleobacter]BDW10724.1 hypothetical protein PSHI2_08060 [Polynucleobacter sp. SHI2]BDW13170.1 hypothetical protein PSHI8_08060 [Polynucleobacter sp. SHI8]
MAKATTKDRILASLRGTKSKVFLRDDFNRFGTYRQVCRVVKELSDEGKLIRLGYGTYVKAHPSTISGKPVADESLINIGLETMQKLGVKADVGKDLRALFQGESTQVPMVPVVNIGKSRVSRKIALGNRKLVYEKN